MLDRFKKNWTLCVGPQTPTQWKSESVTDSLLNYRPTGWSRTGGGARDAYASEKELAKRGLQVQRNPKTSQKCHN